MWPVLRAVALIDEDKEAADGRAGLALQLGDELVKAVRALAPELVDECAEQAGPGLAEVRHQVMAAAGALDGIAGGGEEPHRGSCGSRYILDRE